MNDPTGGSDLDILGWIQATRPDVAKQLSDMGTLDERAGLVDEQTAQKQHQLALIQALMQRQGPQRHTGLGAALQGMGELGGVIAGGIRGQGVQDQLGALGKEKAGLLDKKDAGRDAYRQAIIDYLRTPEKLRRPAEPFALPEWGG